MKIKMLVMDVDGTMTDGNIYMSANGEPSGALNSSLRKSVSLMRSYMFLSMQLKGMFDAP